MKNKSRRWGVGITAGLLLAAAGVARLRPPERLLFQEARRVANAATITQWISDHETLRSPDFESDDLPVFTRRDLATGAVRTSQLPYPDMTGRRAGLNVSPDGTWAQWYSNGEVKCVNLSTGRTVSWPEEGDTYHYGNQWMLDSRRWLQITTVADGYLALHNVEDPRHSLKLAFPSHQVRWWVDYTVTASDHVVFWQADERSVDFKEYRLLPKVQRVAYRHIELPGATKFAELAISHDGKQIAWKLRATERHPWIARLHRFLPFVPLRLQSQEMNLLYVSRIDGADFREIGHCEPVTALDGEQKEIQAIEWLPGDRRLSFDYMDGLYTVPAD